MITPHIPKCSAMYGSLDLIMPVNSLSKNGDKQELKDLVKSFELIFDNVYSGIIFCDDNCKILYMNKFYADLLKTDKKNAVGKHIKDYFPTSRVSAVLKTGAMEFEQRCSLRSEINLLINRIPIKNNGKTIGVVLQTVFKNINEINSLLAKLNLLEKEIKFYKSGLDSILSPTYTFENIIGENKLLVEAKRNAEKYAKTNSSILILGATGTGKELFAHSIHMSSPRERGPFVCVNCAAIPKELLESELFGYESGAFTGAQQKGKTGRIELAHKGTLFLDEIGDIPINAQAKILRVLETKKIDKLGGTKSIDIDFRLVTATNRNIREMINHREFREDLFYRINTMTLEIPALSERVDDIPKLVGYFLTSIAKPSVKVSEDAIKMLKNYHWPGNIRELKNIIEQAVSLSDNGLIGIEHLPNEIRIMKPKCNKMPISTIKPLSEELAQYEKEILIHTLNSVKGNKSKTAKLLGISRSTLYEKCNMHQL